MKKYLIIVASIALIFSSCSQQPGALLYERENFSDYIWNQDDIITFEVENKDANSNYELIFLLRHAPFYPLENLDIYFTEISPSGSKTSKLYGIPIKNKDGSWQGECHGDLCDLEVFIIPDYHFSENGTYTYEIRHQMNDNPQLNGVLSVGVLLRTPEVEEEN